MREPAGFRDFVAARSAALVRSAWLLTGDEQLARDLVQETLARVWRRWPAIRRQDAPEAYVRRVMLSIFLSWRRRRWRGELPVAAVPDRVAAGDPFADADRRASVRQALLALPPRQRAVIVLRYFDDLSEARTAEVLGCSVGTVKSQSAKAMAALRRCEFLQQEVTP